MPEAPDFRPVAGLAYKRIVGRNAAIVANACKTLPMSVAGSWASSP